MKNVLLTLMAHADEFSSTEQNIAHFIKENPNEVADMSVRELANQTFSSASSIVRFCKRLGFNGFKDFQRELLMDMASLKNSDSSDLYETAIFEDDSLMDVVRKISFNNIKSIENALSLLDEDLIRSCVDLIYDAKNVILLGIGSSHFVAQDLYLKLLRLNKNSACNECWHSQILQARNATQEDVAIIFSYSGQTEEMIECMKVLKERKTPCIAITRYVSTPISKLADYNLYVAPYEPIIRKGAMASRIAQLNIVDILYSLLVVKEFDYSMNQLAYTHFYKHDSDE